MSKSMNLKKQKKDVVFIFDKIKFRQNGLSDKTFDNAMIIPNKMQQL